MHCLHILRAHVVVNEIMVEACIISTKSPANSTTDMMSFERFRNTSFTVPFSAQ